MQVINIKRFGSMYYPMYTLIEKRLSLLPHAVYGIFMFLINLGLSQQKQEREECVAMQGNGERLFQSDIGEESKEGSSGED